MEFLLVIGLIIFIAILMPKPDLSKVNAAAEKLVIEKKKCPPHQWFWQEVVDQDGNKHGERIVCKVCGPMRSDSN
jgi:hypothetical protein